MNFSINIQREDSVVRWTMHKEEKPIIKKVKAKVKAKVSPASNDIMRFLHRPCSQY